MPNDKKFKRPSELVIGDYVILEPKGSKAKIIAWLEKPYWASVEFLDGGRDLAHTSKLTYAPWLAKKKPIKRKK
jgi:hypothetical protein